MSSKADRRSTVGNILSLIHTATNGNWTRNYTYANDSNRLATTTVGTTTQTYTHNAHGSFTSMPHLDNMDWTPDERLLHVKRGTSQTWYTYDSTGQRVRKVTEKGSITEERLYLGGFEIYRKRQGTTVTLERETLHLMDGNRRIAMVETKTIGTTTTPLPATVTRYQLDNHLQSASLELDETASVISYEEYYPYGDTSYRSARSGVEVSEKRYRYTGKEKDEETGLYYHGARYYAAWLGRWTAADPAGMVDGACLYGYVRGNPILHLDPSGKWKMLFSFSSPTLNTDPATMGAKKIEPGFGVQFEKESAPGNMARAKDELVKIGVDKALGFGPRIPIKIAKKIINYVIPKGVDVFTDDFLDKAKNTEIDMGSGAKIPLIGIIDLKANARFGGEQTRWENYPEQFDLLRKELSSIKPIQDAVKKLGFDLFSGNTDSLAPVFKDLATFKNEGLQKSDAITRELTGNGMTKEKAETEIKDKAIETGKDKIRETIEDKASDAFTPKNPLERALFAITKAAVSLLLTRYPCASVMLHT